MSTDASLQSWKGEEGDSVSVDDASLPQALRSHMLGWKQEPQNNDSSSSSIASYENQSHDTSFSSTISRDSTSLSHTALSNDDDSDERQKTRTGILLSLHA